jgi:hypothetical protein
MAPSDATRAPFLMMNPQSFRRPPWSRLAAALAGLLCCALAWATADGPDHYRVQGVTAAEGLPLHGKPKAKSAILGRIPADAQCLRNLGCSGGLSLEEFNALGEAEKQQRLATHPRWCNVEHQGLTGWVEARFLAEAGCAGGAAGAGTAAEGPGQAALLPGQRIEKLEFTHEQRSVTIKQKLAGREFIDYQLRAGAGQTLTVTLKAGNPQNYFNILPPGSEAAMFIGSSSGTRFSRRLPSEGEYTIRVYLMRAAARRNEPSRYSLEVRLTGERLPVIPARQDALIPGTPFHASANIACAADIGQAPTGCEAFVIRRRIDGTATVEVRWHEGTLQGSARILFIRGKPVSSDATGSLGHTRKGDVTQVRLGSGLSFDLPDALVSGG